MIMKSNLGKMLGRMAPQQGAGMTVQPQQPQLGGGLMAGLNQPNPPGGVTSSDMIGTLGRMLGGRRPMRPTNTGEGIVVQPAIPQPYQEGPMALPGGTGYDEQGNMLRSNPNNLAGIGGILSKFAEQFRNAESMPKTYTSAPRQLTEEELIAITSMPQRPQGMTLSNAPQQQRLTLGNVPQQAPAQMPDIVVAPRPAEMPQGVGQVSGVGNPIPKFDPNSALQNYNMTLKRLYEGGAKMDLNAAREQQGILRNLQTNLSATPEQHNEAYRTALADLRARYPDAFAG